MATVGRTCAPHCPTPVCSPWLAFHAGPGPEILDQRWASCWLSSPPPRRRTCPPWPVRLGRRFRRRDLRRTGVWRRPLAPRAVDAHRPFGGALLWFREPRRPGRRLGARVIWPSDRYRGRLRRPTGRHHWHPERWRSRRRSLDDARSPDPCDGDCGGRLVLHPGAGNFQRGCRRRECPGCIGLSALDLAMFALVGRALYRNGRIGASLWLLLPALVASAATDAAGLFAFSSGTVSPAWLAIGGSLLGNAFVAAAAVHPSLSRPLLCRPTAHRPLPPRPCCTGRGRQR